MPEVPLQPAHRRLPEGGHQFGVFGKAFVGTPPADILGNGDAGAEGPLDPRGAHLLGRDPVDLLDQFRVARAPQGDVMGKDDGAQDVAVAVHRVHPVQHRDPEPRLHRLRLHPVVQVGPGLERVPLHGIGIPPAEHRADEIFLHVARAGHHGPLLRLGHLPDLLLERHPRHERLRLGVVEREAFGFGVHRCRTAPKQKAAGRRRAQSVFHRFSPFP